MTNNLEQKAVEEALFAFCRERSAQMGEPLTHEDFYVLKEQDLTAWDEEIVQMKCAISAYNRNMGTRLAKRIVAATKALNDLIDGGEECRGRDNEISTIIRILDGEAV